MKDPGSAITHLIAMVSAAIAAVPLLIKAAKTPGYLHLAALAVFILSMICLYSMGMCMVSNCRITGAIRMRFGQVWKLR